MKMKRLVIAMLSLVMFGGVMSTLAGCGKKDAATHFEVWLPSGEDATFYTSYKDNPVVRYLESKSWSSSAESSGTKLTYNWRIPSSGDPVDDIARAISTNTYAHVIDATSITNVMSVNQLYEKDYILDLTGYVNQYMPNYKKYLEENPVLAKTATNLMPDGSKKHLQIWSYQGEEGMWGGWVYRRDWLAKYGTYPVGHEKAGQPFGEGKFNKTAKTGAMEDWTDNVVFPSWCDSSIKNWYLSNVDSTWDGKDPVTIADWEWMLSIFAKAISAQSISKGYSMGMYYPGYMETGDLVTSFGGGGATWYLNPSKENAYFGLTDSSFRSYLECVSSWYKAGYINKNFNENTDIFYENDTSTVSSGKAGLWWGMNSQLVNGMDISDGKPNSEVNGYTNGACVYGARQPINTTYGDASVQKKIPTQMYQTTQEMRSFIVTDKAKEKDLATFFTMMDYMYSDEGSVLTGYGLSKQQYEEYKTSTGKTIPVMERFVDESGIFTRSDAGILYNNKVNSASAEDALRGSRLWGNSPREQLKDPAQDEKTMKHCQDEFTFFRLKGDISSSFLAQMTSADSSKYNDIKTNIREFGETNVYKYIKHGTAGYMDITNNTIWNNWCTAINMRKPAEATAILQALLDRINAN